jgi:hypothetical protein
MTPLLTELRHFIRPAVLTEGLAAFNVLMDLLA